MMLPRYCNNQPLPCGPSGLCVDNELLEQIMVLLFLLILLLLLV